jgi:hypothetical protein
MLGILFWLVIFILGSNFVFTEGLGLIPNLVIVGVSRRFGWLVLGAIAVFFLWCFAEE